MDIIGNKHGGSFWKLTGWDVKLSHLRWFVGLDLFII